MKEELKEWLGIKTADFIVYAAAVAVFGMYLNKDVWLDIVLAVSAVALCVISCAVGMRPNPQLSAFSNLAKRFSYPTCVVVVLVCVCFNFAYWQPRSDSLIRQKIIGTWTRDGVGVARFLADGSYSSAWTNRRSEPPKAWSYAGTWQVTNGNCLMTTTNTGAWNATNSQAIGSTELWKIVRLKDTELVWKLDNQTVTLMRTK